MIEDFWNETKLQDVKVSSMYLLVCLVPNVAVWQLQLKGFAYGFWEVPADPATCFIISPRRIRKDDAHCAGQSDEVGELI